jgi:hypothetical protein
MTIFSGCPFLLPFGCPLRHLSFLGMWTYAICSAIFALEIFFTVFIYQDMKELKTYDG